MDMACGHGLVAPAWVLVLATCATCGPSTATVVRRDDELNTTTPIVRPPGEVTCTANVEPLTRAFDTEGGAWGDELADLLQDRCLSDGWSAAARACIDDAATYTACLSRTLAGWQRDRLLGVVASDHLFDVSTTPHYAEFRCAMECAPPAPATPCEAAAQRIARDLAAKYGTPVMPSVVWAGLTGMLLDQCRILEWPAAAATCFGDLGLVAACTNQLTPKQKHDPELVIARWLQQLERSFPSAPAP